VADLMGMRRTLLISTTLLGISTIAAADSRLVVSSPTQAGYELGVQPVADDPSVSVSARAQSRTVYLNRTGVSLTPGANDSRTNHSSIINSAVTVPPWGASETLWQQTATCLREMFAPFDITITETDPGNTPHMEAVFGGSPLALGFGSSMAGVSPFSTTCKVLENSIVFTFTDVIPQKPQIACEIMAQEIAHSYGLDHELVPADPMTYLPYAGKRTFQDVDAQCGETTARPCGIAGNASCRASQNSYALLMERIGAAGTGDLEAPTVKIMSPADGATVNAGFTITAALADDVKIKLAVLMIDGVSVGSLTAEPWTFTAPADLARGRHVNAVKATDGTNEQIETIEVVVRDANGDTGEDDDSAVGGCSTGGGTGWLFGLLLVGLVAIQRRAQR
jgi:MYXO-CTERM domain-containing protein